ncbi:MAG: hypothetical protein SFX19_03560 [Alphaproteobacteria bacterium]|nr:hypothetical protein [Alphaproteobacteria bacterium]
MKHDLFTYAAVHAESEYVSMINVALEKCDKDWENTRQALYEIANTQQLDLDGNLPDLDELIPRYPALESLKQIVALHARFFQQTPSSEVVPPDASFSPPKPLGRWTAEQLFSPADPAAIDRSRDN